MQDFNVITLGSKAFALVLVLAIVHVALPIDLGCLDMNAWL